VKNLTNSIILLLAYIFLVLGVAEIRAFERNVVYFESAFFVMMTIAVFAGIIHFGRYRPSIYSYLTIWAVIYVLTWQFFWRSQASPPYPRELAIQFVLVEVAAGIAYNVGSNLIEFGVLLDSLSFNTYPNRTLEMNSATDRIRAEITRSRRYSRPLSVLLLQLDQIDEEHYRRQLKRIEPDLLRRFAAAKVGHIINAHSRQTDLVMRDQAGRFVILCPETDTKDCTNLAGRIREAVQEDLGDKVAWGIASFPGETLEFDELLERAAQRMGEHEVSGEVQVEERTAEQPVD